MLYITPWERDALRLVAQNGTATEVAVCLGIETRDVAAHLTELFSRMGVSNRSDALDCAWRRGLLDAEALELMRARSA